MLPDLAHIDAALFTVALAIAYGAFHLSRYLWLRVGQEEGRKARMYSPKEFISDLKSSKKKGI